MTRKYHINIFWSDRDDCWVADVPDLRHCSAFGQTPADAISEIGEAIEAWLESAKANGLPIPEARYRPAIYAVPHAA